MLHRKGDWTPEELRRLKEAWLAPDPLTPSEIAQAATNGYRSGHACRKKANECGWLRNPMAVRAILSRRRKERPPRVSADCNLTPAQMAWLRDIWTSESDMSSVEIGAVLGLSMDQVRYICKNRGWRRNPGAMHRLRVRGGGIRPNAGLPRVTAAEWPPHRFEDDPREAERSRRAIPIKMTPSGFLGSAVGCSAAMAAVG